MVGLCTMPPSKVSALALCNPAGKYVLALPRVRGHRSCQNKHWCGGERRRWKGTRGLLWVEPEGSAGMIWSRVLAAHCEGNSGCELGLTSLFMPKPSHHCIIHEHGHVFYLQTPCKDQVWAKADWHARLLGAELVLSLWDLSGGFLVPCLAVSALARIPLWRVSK